MKETVVREIVHPEALHKEEYVEVRDVHTHHHSGKEHHLKGEHHLHAEPHLHG